MKQPSVELRLAGLTHLPTVSCTSPLSEVHPTHVGEKIQAMTEEVVRDPGTKWMLLTQYWGQDWQGEREGESLESVLSSYILYIM